MRFTLDASWGEEGRLEGMVAWEGSGQAQAFSGIVELVGTLEGQLGPKPLPEPGVVLRGPGR